MSDGIAISVKNVSKDFILPHEKVRSIKGLFTKAFNRDKSYEKQHVLKDISFEIKKGEFFGIVGRNGSGKSTLLKIIAGIYQPTRGSVKINGRLVPFIELGVGFSPDLSGRENVYLNGAMLGFSKKEVDEKYSQIVDFAELEKFMDQKLKNFSSGMQVGLAFSVATVLAESDILLIDEVLAVGDADFQKKCFDYFFELKKDRKTVIFISHDMGAIKTYCDRAAVINEGVVEYCGEVDAVSEIYYKLFSNNQQKIKAKRSVRWGNGAVMFKNVFTEVLNGITKINLDICARDTVDNIELGYSISDGTNDQVIYGQSISDDLGLPSTISKGQIIHVEIDVPNILRDGNYFLELALHGRGGLPVYDWIHGASKIYYNNRRSSPYAVQPEIKIRFSVNS